ncbi:MAG: hypothetical protein M1431_04765 [Candidatus Thermoplasmatota archaeon]|nr:hypothetical protein [Candidatus Thermoplasmatota archaeon]
MKTSKVRWRELMFRSQEVSTDSVYYMEKSGLLLPMRNSENRFLATFSRQETRFFIGSLDGASMRRMDLFFQRVYQTVSAPCSVTEDHVDPIYLSNSILNRRIRNFYHPSFIRTIFDIIHTSELENMNYEVILRSAGLAFGRRRFNFVLKIWTSAPEGLDEIRDLVIAAVREIRTDGKWRFRFDRKSTTTDLLSNSRNMINFLRIPSEKDTLHT